jgi:amino acid transporter, AAT family
MTQDTEFERGLHHKLTAGRMAMVAIGSTIGTGLLLGSGAAVHIAGPAIVLTYVIGAFLAWIVTNALGELSSAHPAAGSFGVYAELYLNPWAGFVASYGYWYGVVLSIGAELVAASTYCKYWFPTVPGIVWTVIYAAALLFINFLDVGDFGRFEYWLAMVKVVTIVVFILAGTWLLLGGQIAPQYRVQGGFLPLGWSSPLLAVSFALFSFFGIEVVAISSGEARAKNEIARANRIMFALLAFIYIGATAILVGVLPWSRVGVGESPFVTVFVVAGVSAASTLMNFVVLTAALSASNAALYSASRMLFSLARHGWAPPAFGRLNKKGSPRLALLASAIGVPMALLMERYMTQSAFLYFIGASLFGGMVAWCVALAAHISFRRQTSPEELAALPFHAPGGAWLSGLGLAGIMLAVVSTWWVPQSRITIVSGIPYVVVLTVAYWVVGRRWRTTAISDVPLLR